MGFGLLYPEPRGPRVLPVGELVLWYGMFAPCGRLLGTMGFAHGAPLWREGNGIEMSSAFHGTFKERLNFLWRSLTQIFALW